MSVLDLAGWLVHEEKPPVHVKEREREETYVHVHVCNRGDRLLTVIREG